MSPGYIPNSQYSQPTPHRPHPPPLAFLSCIPHSPSHAESDHCSVALACLAVPYLQAFAQTVSSAWTLSSSPADLRWPTPAHRSTSTLIALPRKPCWPSPGSLCPGSLITVLIALGCNSLTTGQDCLSSACLQGPQEQRLNHHWSAVHSTGVGTQ